MHSCKARRRSNLLQALHAAYLNSSNGVLLVDWQRQSQDGLGVLVGICRWRRRGLLRRNKALHRPRLLQCVHALDTAQRALIKHGFLYLL